MSTEIVIIGGGVVGLTAAILLATKGFKVTIYERMKLASKNEIDSYPVGISTRGLRVLRQLDIHLNGEAKDYLEIYRKSKRVAKIRTGNTLEVYRTALIDALMDKLKVLDNVVIKYGHKLVDIDFEKRLLLFDHNDTKLTIDGSNSRVIAADGAFSKSRKLLVSHDLKKYRTTTAHSGFRDCTTIPWTYKFKVLYCKQDCQIPLLNPKTSYIFQGCYTTFLKNRWTVTVVNLA